MLHSGLYYTLSNTKCIFIDFYKHKEEVELITLSSFESLISYVEDRLVHCQQVSIPYAIHCGSCRLQVPLHPAVQ